MKRSLQTSIFNLRQRIRYRLKQPPLLCHALHKRSAFCQGCEPGMAFPCSTCNRLMPWCRGAADDYPEICDDCYSIACQMHQVVGDKQL